MRPIREIQVFLTLFALCLLTSSFAWAEGYARPELLISPRELAGIAKKENVRILDARSESDYTKGHIAGAVSVYYNRLVDYDARHKNGFPTDPKNAETIFGGVGIDKDTTVVIYGGGEGPPASGLWFVVDFFGHKKVRVLNGGLRRWLKEGWPMTKAVPDFIPKTFIAKPGKKKVVSLKWMRKNYRRKDVMFVDTRSLKEHIGETVLSGASRGGHIPGSINLDWKKLSDEVKTYKSADELKAILAKKGITADTKVVAYCHQGIGRATDLVLAMRLIGYDKVLEYTGSWQEWSRDPRLPVEK